jgi:hypothetical protein
VADRFKEHGIDLSGELKKAKAEGRDLLETITDLTMKASKGDKDEIFRLFGDQQVQMAIIALNGNLKEYISLRDEVSNSSGLVDSQFAERMKDQATRWDKMKSQWSDFEVEIGKSMKPVTDTLLDGAISVLDRLTANIRARGLVTTLGNVVTGGNGLIPKADLDRLEAQKKAAGEQRVVVLRSLEDVKRFKVQMGKELGSRADYASIGRMMMDGVAAGMAEGKPTLLASVLSIASVVKAAFRRNMKIHSPSRVFAGYGRSISDGLAVGIEGGRAKPLLAVRALARDVAAEGTPSTPRLSAPRPRSGPTEKPVRSATMPAVNITNHITQQPGEDAETLAQRISDLIARQAKVAQRGAYVDE